MTIGLVRALRRWLAAVVVSLSAAALGADNALVVVSGAGQFAGAADLSAERDADAIAALEQQAFRELRWTVQQAAAFELRFDPTEAEAATARLMVSEDSETFAPLAADLVVPPGQVLSLVVAQQQSVLNGIATFPSSDWLYEIIARPTPALAGGTIGPILIPIEIGRDLGCEVPGCGDNIETGTAPVIGGGAFTETVAPPSAPTTGTSSDRELARELQTELARVGCYTLAIDGLWGPGSRRAMTAFNEATGASLAVATPTARALVEVARSTETVCAP